MKRTLMLLLAATLALPFAHGAEAVSTRTSTPSGSTAPVSSESKAKQTYDKAQKAWQKAVAADKVQDALAALEEMKRSAEKLSDAWYYYNACCEYRSTRLSVNWKDREAADAALKSEIETFGSPIALYAWKRDYADGGDLETFVRDNSKKLQNSHNPLFYSDISGRGVVYSIVRPRLGSDYEYCLWNIERFADLESFYKGAYPLAPLARYCRISGWNVENRDSLLCTFAKEFEGREVSAPARFDLLQSRFEKLSRPDSKAVEADFKALRSDIEALRTFVKKIPSGYDFDFLLKDIDGLAAELDAKQVDARIEDGTVTIMLRNLSSCRVSLEKDGKSVWKQVVSSSESKYYIKDTVRLALGVIDDGSYDFVCTDAAGAKRYFSDRYRQYTISLATRRDADGYAVFAADYKSGQPLREATLRLCDNKDKQIAQTSLGSSEGGFVYLDKSFCANLSDKRSARLSAEYRDSSGRLHLSEDVYMYAYSNAGVAKEDTSLRAVLITDKGAYTPGETLHFKAVLYRGLYAFDLADAGTKVKLTLFDAKYDEIASTVLAAGEFGSVAGEFELPSGARGGIWQLRAEISGSYLASRSIRVDEFVLPTFDVQWDEDDRFYLPGDTARLSGRIMSYSGHTLAGAEASFELSSWSEDSKRTGEVPVSEDGRFCIEVPCSKNPWASNTLTLRVKDGTLETLEFQKYIRVSSQIPLGLGLLNAAEGTFSADRFSGDILSESGARFDIHCGSYPGMKMHYTLSDQDGRTESGSCAVGEFPLDMGGKPSGMYTFRLSAEAVSENGTPYNEERELRFILVRKSDTALESGIAAFFMNTDDDGSLSVLAGSSEGPVWIVADLYGEGNRLLGHKVVRLEGKAGQAGSLKRIGFERKASYPQNMSLRLLFFKNGNNYTYSREFEAPESRDLLPLSFTRFTDTAVPGGRYSFSIATNRDVECAASIYDVSSETIWSGKWFAVKPYSRPLPDVDYNCLNGFCGTSPMAYVNGYRMLTKAAGLMSADAVEESAVFLAADDMAPSPSEEEAAAVRIRNDFATTLLWAPQMRSGADGSLTFDFTASDKLSTYIVQVFAHDSKFNNAVLSAEMLVTIPVKVAVVQPQFLYEGDSYAVNVTLSSSLATSSKGTLSVALYDGSLIPAGSVPTGQKALFKAERKVTVPAEGGAAFSFDALELPESVGELAVLVRFTSSSDSQASDAVLVRVPCHPAAQTITEAHSALLHNDADRDAVEKDLRSRFVNLPGEDASLREISILDMLAAALPEAVMPRGDNAIALSSAFYAGALSDSLRSAGAFGVQADEKSADSFRDVASKLRSCLNSDGGVAWMAGMYSSPLVTALVLERAASCPALRTALGEKALREAVIYLDKAYFAPRKTWYGGPGMEAYMHVRSRWSGVEFDARTADKAILKSFRKDAKAYLVPSGARGLNALMISKARRVEILRGLNATDDGRALARDWGIRLCAARRMAKSVEADLASLAQYAVPHDCGGFYFPNAVMPWRGLLEGELYAHTLICGALESARPDIAEGLRLWMMIQKETQQWESDPAFVEALGCISRASEETLGTKVLVLENSGRLPFGDIRPSGNGMSIAAEFIVDGKPVAEGTVLHVGDKIRAEYRLRSDENRSFVRLDAPRPASFRPAEQLSGYWSIRPVLEGGILRVRPQIYRQVLAERSLYWMDVCPEEETVITEEFLVSQEGVFQSPAVKVESLYAPHYRAVDSSKVIESDSGRRE